MLVRKEGPITIRQIVYTLAPASNTLIFGQMRGARPSWASKSRKTREVMVKEMTRELIRLRRLRPIRADEVISDFTLIEENPILDVLASISDE